MTVWQLYPSDDTGEWVALGNYESLAAATKRIIDAELIPGRGLSYQVYVNADATKDDQLLGHLEFRGKYAAYVIKRQPH